MNRRRRFSIVPFGKEMTMQSSKRTARIASVLGAMLLLSSFALAQTNTFPSTGNADIGTLSPGVLLDFPSAGRRCKPRPRN